MWVRRVGGQRMRIGSGPGQHEQQHGGEGLGVGRGKVTGGTKGMRRMYDVAYAG